MVFPISGRKKEDEVEVDNKTLNAISFGKKKKQQNQRKENTEEVMDVQSGW